jgi:hypothetical protein
MVVWGKETQEGGVNPAPTKARANHEGERGRAVGWESRTVR